MSDPILKHAKILTYNDDFQNVMRRFLKGDEGLVEAMQEMGRTYPKAGYGGMFRKWLASENPEPYNSFGNGSAMRVASIGWLFDTIEEVRIEAEKTALPTHNHPEGIKGAIATAEAIFLARKYGKTEMLAAMTQYYPHSRTWIIALFSLNNLRRHTYLYGYLQIRL